MCGLVGVAGSLEYKDEGLMRRLLLLDYFRGIDSTGLAAIRNTGEPHIAKIASHPIDLFDLSKFKSALTGSTSKAFIGHNRAATKGAVNGVNAHPYECGHIIGAHNGTLSPKSYSDLEDAINEKTGTDSHAIFLAIERLGLDETMKLLQGAWSLTWYNREENTLNFLRNKERPMWYAWTKDFSRFIWASEWTFIDAAIKMGTQGQYDLLVEDKTGYKYWGTEEDTHYKFDMAELSSALKEKPRPKPVVRELKGKDAALACGTDPFGRSSAGTGYGQWVKGQFYRHGETIPSTTSSHSSQTAVRKEKVVTDNVISLLGSKADPFAGAMSKEHFDAIAKYGCSWCQDNVEYDDVGITVFERDDIVLCAGCSGNEDKDGRKHSRVYVQNFENLI